jgi:hypothetical protein
MEIDMCPFDVFPCSCYVKGVGIGGCVKRFRDKVKLCCRCSDASIFEPSSHVEEEEAEWLTRSDINKRFRDGGR